MAPVNILLHEHSLLIAALQWDHWLCVAALGTLAVRCVLSACSMKSR